MRRNKLVAVQWCHPLALGRLALAAFITILLVLMPQAARASELLTNGDFSTGNLNGWSTYTNYDGTWSAYSGSTVNGQTVPSPSGYGAITDLGNTNGGAHVLYQTFTVPTEATSLNVSFDMFLWNPAGVGWMEKHNFDIQMNHQEAWIDILGPGADPTSPSAVALYTLFHTVDGQISSIPTGFSATNLAIPTFTPGSTYTLRFVEVNNSGSGPVYMGLDNVSVLASAATSGGGGDTGDTEAPEPGTLLLIGSGFVAFGVWRRKVSSAAAAA